MKFGNVASARFVWRPLAALQIEPADCGYVCASVLAQMHGYDLTPEALKDICGISNRGLAISQLKRMMAIAGLPCDAIAVSGLSAELIPEPCIALTMNQHYVVLGKRRRKGCRDVFDPALGWRIAAPIEVQELLHGIVLRIQPAVPRTGRRVKMVPIWPLLRNVGLGWSLAPLAALGVVTLLGQIFMPGLAGKGMDAAVSRVVDFDFITFAALYACMAFGAAATQAMAGFRGAILGAHINSRLASQLFDRLLKQPLEYFERYSPNSLLALFDGIRSIQYLISAHAVQAGLACLLGIVSIVVMARASLALTGVALVSVAVFFAIQYAFSGPILRSRERSFRAGAARRGFLLDALSVAAPVIRSGSETSVSTVHDGYLRDVETAAHSEAQVTMVNTGIKSIALQSDRLLFLLVGMYLLQNDAMTFGAFVAFGLYRELFRSSIDSIAAAAMDYRFLRYHRLRMTPLLTPPDEAPRRQIGRGTIAMRDVSFRYTAFESPVVANFNLSVDAGEFILIRGPSGIGKSTLARLLLGLSRPQSGTIMIDGESVCGSMFGASGALQTDRLINATLAQNILLYRIGFTEAEIESAVEFACAREFIEALPMQYQTIVSDSYSGLSAGQRQRLLLARALLGSPRLVVLDEATNHLDSVIEATIMERLAKMASTKIVISHRADLAKYADRVITLDHNGYAERRTPIAYA